MPFSKLASEEQLKQMTAPHLAMPSAMEKPMPWAPPVIRATLPCRLNADRSMMFSFFHSIQVNFLAKRPVPVSRYGAFDWCF